MKRCNVAVAIVSIALGILILWLSSDLSGYDEHGVPGERYWPAIIAWLLVGLGLLQFLELWTTPGTNRDKPVDLHSPAVRLAYLGASVSVLYGILLLGAGFELATLVFVPVLMRLMGERRIIALTVAPIVVVGTIYIFFTQVFNTTLPVSVFFE
ncbi:MAG: tripartite tricarboxylate transporter TctB family protein [Propionivibrio sp.]